MTQHNPHLTTTPDPERGTAMERLERIRRATLPKIGYAAEGDRPLVTIAPIDDCGYYRIECHYGPQYTRRHVAIEGLHESRIVERMHILLDEVEADLGIFEPKTIEVAA